MAPVGRTLVDRLPEPEVRELLTSCLAAPSWVDGMLAGRPYVDRDAVLARGIELAARLTDADVEAALARHPRIGERPHDSHDAELSAAEQAGVDPADEEVAAALRAGNAEYEQRFGRVFLIRAAGRSSREILDELRRRLGNPAEDESRETAAQLAEIGMLRLAALVPEETVVPEDVVNGSTVSTHVLDAARGVPGAGISVVLERLQPHERIGTGTTDDDGRVSALARVEPGTYRLSFDTGAYLGTETFFPRVDVVFSVTEDDGHYHVPLLLSPFSYSTYRGS